MARTFRFYEKKRGHRRTGSPRLASTGELIFYAVLSLGGIVGMLTMIVLWIVPDWRVNHDFIETPCRVIETRIVQTRSEGGTLFRPEVSIEYQIDGQTYPAWTYGIQPVYFGDRTSAEAALAAFRPSSANEPGYYCWYDPVNPRVVVVTRGYSWWIWLALAVPGAFLLAGAGGFVYAWTRWGRSAEHAAALAHKVREGELFRAANRGRRDYPYVPDGAEIDNSPGTRLKYRLPISNSPGWALATALAAAVGWNGLVCAWAIIAFVGRRLGQPDWFQMFFLVPFALVGLGLIAWFIRQLLVTAGIGATFVEVSDHPLFAGRPYRLFLSQLGHLRIERLEAALVCLEEATFRQGTDTRTESREVHRQLLMRHESVAVERNAPFEAECEVALPEQVMHSFKATHNAVRWMIVVRGDIPRWRSFTRTFPLVVRPAAALEHTAKAVARPMTVEPTPARAVTANPAPVAPMADDPALGAAKEAMP